MYLRALNNEDGRWAVYHFSSLDNPHLPKEALNEMVQDMLEDAYKQEILAEFVAGEGQIFKLFLEDFIDAEDLEIHKEHRLVCGLDWGQKNDYTALSIGCATCSKELVLERYKRLDYPTQRDRIKKLLPEKVEVLAEENAMGLPNIQQMRTDGVPVMGFITTNASKAQVVQALRLCFEQRSWKWVNNPEALRELEAYEAKVSLSGSITYNAPSGLNDDTVVARMLMLRQATAGRLSFA